MQFCIFEVVFGLVNPMHTRPPTHRRRPRQRIINEKKVVHCQKPIFPQKKSLSSIKATPVFRLTFFWGSLDTHPFQIKKIRRRKGMSKVSRSMFLFNLITIPLDRFCIESVLRKKRNKGFHEMIVRCLSTGRRWIFCATSFSPKNLIQATKLSGWEIASK